jgi:hypothetical protein
MTQRDRSGIGAAVLRLFGRRPSSGAPGEDEEMVAWKRGAEAHLRALQDANDRLSEVLGQVRQDLEHANAWRAAAETHLAALQSESECARSIANRHEDQLLRHEIRIGDLERSDTEIAAAIARARLPPAV